MLDVLKYLYKVFSTISIIILLVWFVRWYIKGHSGKYAILFWLNTVLACYMYYNTKTNPPVEDPTPGYVYWERNVKNH